MPKLTLSLVGELLLLLLLLLLTADELVTALLVLPLLTLDLSLVPEMLAVVETTLDDEAKAAALAAEALEADACAARASDGSGAPALW